MRNVLSSSHTSTEDNYTSHKSSSGACLCPFWPLSHPATHWIAYTQQNFPSRSPGGWRSALRGPAWLAEGPPAAGRPSLCPRRVGGQRGLSGGSLVRVLLQRMGPLPSWGKHFPQPPSPSGRKFSWPPLGVRILSCGFGRWRQTLG